MKTKISIIGLGYVGLPLAVEFGKFFETVGYDIDLKKIINFKKRKFNNLIKINNFNSAKKLSLTNDQEKLKNSNFFIITVPTPIYKNKKPDLRALILATKIVSNYVKKNSIIIFESTVFPGVTEEVCIPIIERISKLKLNIDFKVGYSPERISPGDKSDIRKINKIISGSDKKSLESLYKLYRKIIKAKLYKAKSIKIAECAKLVENAQRDINISFINEVSLICSKLNLHTSDVLAAAKTKWNFLDFKPGLVGGHCISVDPFYLTYIAKKKNYSPKVILSGRTINDNMGVYIAKVVLKKLKEKKIDFNKAKVGLMGITFKEECGDIRGSKILDTIKILRNKKINVSVYDPFVNLSELSKVDPNIKIKKLKGKFDILIIAVSHKEFLKLNYDYIKRLLKTKDSLLFDIKSIFNKDTLLKKEIKFWSL